MPVPQDATITLRFTGLLVFCFNRQRKRCQIGALPKNHKLRFGVTKKGPKMENDSEQTLTIPQSLIDQASDLWLDVEGEPAPEQRTAEPFIVGKRDEPPTDPRDFRWVADLEGEHFYNRPLKVRNGALRPILSMATGLFYSATLSPDLYRTVPATSNGARRRVTKGRSLGYIAEYIGANIYLTRPDQALVLRAGRNGSELLRLNNEEGSTYEITVENGDMPQAPAGSDFHYYYDAVELNRGEPRILIEPYGLPPLRGSEHPCVPILLSKSDGFGFD